MPTYWQLRLNPVHELMFLFSNFVRIAGRVMKVLTVRLLAATSLLSRRRDIFGIVACS